MSFGIKRLITALILLGGLLSGQSDAALQQKVLFILSADKHGYFLPEVVEPYQVLLEQGFVVDFASPNGDKGYPAAESRLSDNEQTYYKGLLAQGAITQPKKLADIDANDYLAFYVPGGAGPMFDLADNPDVQRLTKEFLRQDKIVAAVCHGPAAFVNVKLDNGDYLATSRKITAKSNDEEGDWARANYPFLLQDKFESQHAQFRFAKPNQPFVIYDRGVLTGQNPASATPVAQRLAQLLKNK